MVAKEKPAKVLVVDESVHHRVRIYAAREMLTLQGAANKLLNSALNKEEVYL